MSKTPTLLELLKAGAHFGHQTSRWHPKMQEYLFGQRGGVHIIDLDKTIIELQKALSYVKTLAATGKVILFVGTKRQARQAVKTAAEKCGSPYLVERWIGGLLTNFSECQRRLKKYASFKEMFKTKEIEKYTKREQGQYKKQLERMDKYLVGLADLEAIPAALYIADLRVEKTAVTEAGRVGVPIVAVCDSNVNPTKAAYPIPANDDAVNSIKLFADLMAEAVNEGKAEFEKKQVAEAVEKEKEAKSSTKIEREAITIAEAPV
jgi:small subunit ribosomal protein S2